MGSRTLYVIKTPCGYLGLRKFSYRTGTYHPRDVSWQQARIFHRAGDAKRCKKERDHIIPITVPEPPNGV